MPAEGKPSEFGGKVQKNGIQPAAPVAVTPSGVPVTVGHVELTASEKLRLVYSTGQDEDASMDPDPLQFVDGGPREEA